MKYFYGKEENTLIGIDDDSSIHVFREIGVPGNTRIVEGKKPEKIKGTRKVRGPGKKKESGIDEKVKDDRAEIIKSFNDGEEVDAIAYRLGIQTRTVGMMIAHARKRGEITVD